MTWPEAVCVVAFTMAVFSIAARMIDRWPKR